MFTRLRRIECGAAIAIGVTTLVVSATIARADHSAFAGEAHDPLLAFYTGTSHPRGVHQVNLAGGLPGYLNVISGGQGNGSAGGVTITAVGNHTLYLVGIAVHVTDAAGPSHLLSALNDPALGDIVADLNLASGGDFAITAYAYNNAPAQYAAL